MKILLTLPLIFLIFGLVVAEEDGLMNLAAVDLDSMPGVSWNDCEGIEYEGTSTIVRHPIDKNLICYPGRFVADSRFAALLAANFVLKDPHEAVSVGAPLPMSFRPDTNAEYEAAWEVNIYSNQSQKIVASFAILVDSGKVVPICDNREQGNSCNIAIPICDSQDDESRCNAGAEANNE